MSHAIDYHASASGPHGAFTGPAGLFRKLVKRYRDRRALNYLLGLPDYQLKDIGVQRGDIQREVLRPLWRP